RLRMQLNKTYAQLYLNKYPLTLHKEVKFDGDNGDEEDRDIRYEAIEQCLQYYSKRREVYTKTANTVMMDKMRFACKRLKRVKEELDKAADTECTCSDYARARQKSSCEFCQSNSD